MNVTNFEFLNQIDEKIQAIVPELTRSPEFTQREVKDLKQQLKLYEHEKMKDNVMIKKLNQDLQTSNT